MLGTCISQRGKHFKGQRRRIERHVSVLSIMKKHLDLYLEDSGVVEKNQRLTTTLYVG